MPVAAESKRDKTKHRARRAEQSAPGAFSLSGNALRYAIAIFVGSTLLFLLEPISAKRLLPLLGGSAAVWTTCLVFFQVALLIGYLAAHALVSRTSVRVQVTIYLALLALSLAQLAFAISPTLEARADRPVTSVALLLTSLIGLPFVTLSATSPLLQSWFARFAGRKQQGTAYRLFAISNVGSIVALLAYPWLIEPRLSLRGQMIAVIGGFVILVAIVGSIALAVRTAPEPDAPEKSTLAAAISSDTRTLWIALAACGSLLLSAVTTHISQNVVAIPLIWIVPLVAYLLSFVIAFTDVSWLPRRIVMGLGVAGLVIVGYLVNQGILNIPIVRAATLFCVALFLLCLFLHAELYRLRPPAPQLTSFYLHVAAGGALGAILVAIVAPVVLQGTYELVLGLVFTAGLGLAVMWAEGRIVRALWAVLAAGAAGLVIVQVANDRVGKVLRVRNFYGTVHVTQVTEQLVNAPVRSLYHGVITHGRQIYRRDLELVPGTYYAPASGLGLALELCCAQRPRRIGAVGLGIGTLAAYGRPGDTIRFYEINPAIKPIADSAFTFVQNSAAKIEVVEGDARVSLSREEPQRYDVLVVDAFSGDAVPVHLINAQAIEVYRRHLAPGGVIAFHVSNRYLDLPPVVEQIARNARMQSVLLFTPEDLTRDAWYSEWVLVSENGDLFSQPAIASRRQQVTQIPGLRLWTDDYSSLLPIIHRKQRGF